MDKVPKEQPNRSSRGRQRPDDWPYGYVARQTANTGGSYARKPNVYSTTNQDEHSHQDGDWQHPKQQNQSHNHHKKILHKIKLPVFKSPKRDRKSFKKKLLFVPAFFTFILVVSLIGTNFLNNPQKAEAAIAARGSNSNGTTTGTTSTLGLTIPAATKVGDLIIVVVVTNSTVTHTISGGSSGTWTTILLCSNAGDDGLRMSAFRKEAVAADAGLTATVAWGGTSIQARGSIASYSGVNRTTPIDTGPTTCASGTGTAMTANSLATGTAGRFVVGAWGVRHTTASAGSVTSATDTVRNTGGTSTNCTLICGQNNIIMGHTDLVQSGTGAITKSATSTISGGWATFVFALRPAADPTLEQAAYRWYPNDTSSVTPGTPTLATNAALTGVKINDIVRLRMLLHVGTAELQVDLIKYKLRYAVRTDATCGDETFEDVATGSGAIRYDATNTPNDGDAITDNGANAPDHSSHIRIPQTYEEANDFNTVAITPSGQDAMWDFALVNNSAPVNTTYCFKITTTANADLNAYGQYPQLTTINVGYETSAYRWFANTDAANPLNSSFMANQDTQITQVKTNDSFRLRMLIHNTGTDAIPAAYENLKLQFAVQSGGSCGATPTGSFGDVATASGAIQYKGNPAPADDATVSAVTGDPSHSGHTIVYHSYQEANNFTTRVSHPNGQDGLWDFSLTNVSAPFGTVYCFRAVKAADGSTITNSVYPQITILNPTFDQKAYRWYDSSDTVTPGTPRAATNTVTTGISTTAQFRLRMLVRIGGDPIVAGTETFKLKFATKSAGTCGAYSDLTTSSGAVRYNTTPTPADAAAITTTANDPVDAGITIRAQTYEESNNFTTNTATAVGEDAMWDFSLQTVSAPIRTTYCFKIVRSSDSDINTYSVTPELTTIDPRYEQAAYRWLANPASPTDTTPGAALAANNTPVSDISQNTIVRLRMLVHVSNDASGVGLENFKLQIAPRSGTCDTAFVGESGNFTDLAAGSGAFRYYDNTGVADGAGISANANDPSHNTDTIVPQTYRESNPFATVTNTPAEQDAMWDFVIINNSAAQNTSWCFRMIKTDGTTDFTSSGGSYSQVAELNTAIAAMSQSAYRWFTNVDTANYLSVGTNPTSGDDKVNGTALDTANGFIYIVGYEGATADNRWRIEKRGTNDGALVSGFGNSGCTTNTAGAICSDPTTGDDQAMAIAIDVSAGYMYVAGFDAGVSPATTAEWRVEKRNLSDGSLVSGTTAGGFTNGVLLEDIYAFPDHINTIAIDTAGGHMYLGGFGTVGNGNQEIRVEKRNLSDGTLVTAFDTDGIIIEDLATSKNDAITSIVLDIANGAIYLGGFDGSPPPASGTGWRVEKRNASTGAIVSGFGNHDATKCDAASGGTTGVYCADVTTGNSDDRITALAIDSTYLFIAGNDTTGAGQWRVDRITLSNNTITAPLFAVEDVTAGEDTIKAMSSDGTNIYLAGYDNGVSPATTREWRYEKRTVAGALVTAFDTDGILVNDVTGGADQINTMALDTTGGFIYAAGFDSSGSNQWRIEKRKISDGTRGWEPSTLAAQDTKVLPGPAIKFRLRMTIHISGETMPVSGETLKLQYAQKVGTCDAAYVGEEGTFQDVGATGDIAYYNNSTAADDAATLALTSDPVHSGHTNIIQTYQEANPFTFATAVTAGQDGLWDFALIDNAAFGNYCFRAVKNDNTVISATVVPEIAFCDRPKTENLIRHGNFFCDDSRKKFYWN